MALAREEAIPPETVRYLNRLSDALFVWSRWASHVTGAKGDNAISEHERELARALGRRLADVARRLGANA